MKDFTSYSDEELMREIKAGNIMAFDTLYEKYSRRLYSFTFSILKSAHETENIIQDVFLSFWINRQNVERISSVRYYLFTIAYNSTISFIREKSRSTRYIEYLRLHQELTVDPVSTQVEYKELKDKLEDIISQLPDRQKEVYLLQKVEGLKYQEIAERLHISVNTIENHMSRALKTIRLKLGKYSFFLFL